MIPFGDYCRQRGFSRQRGSELRKAGRFGESLITRPYGRTHRYFVISVEAADEALEQTAAGPRGKLAKSTLRADLPVSAASRARPKKPTSTDKLDPRTMTKAEAVRMKVAEDALAARCKRISAEIDLEIKRGEYLPVVEIEAEIDEFMAGIVSGLEGIPSRFLQHFPLATTAMVDGLRRLINEVRREIVGE